MKTFPSKEILDEPSVARMLNHDELTELAEFFPDSDTGLIFASIKKFCELNNIRVVL
jgi:hypothetical protein